MLGTKFQRKLAVSPQLYIVLLQPPNFASREACFKKNCDGTPEWCKAVTSADTGLKDRASTGIEPADSMHEGKGTGKGEGSKKAATANNPAVVKQTIQKARKDQKCGWYCPKCKAYNYKRHAVCFKNSCAGTRPAGQAATEVKAARKAKVDNVAKKQKTGTTQAQKLTVDAQNLIDGISIRTAPSHFQM